MFIDASAIIAILAEEPDADDFVALIEASASGSCFYSPLVAFEAIVGLARSKTVADAGSTAPIPRETFDKVREIVMGFLTEIEAVEIAIGPDVRGAALDAARDFGRATGHPAQLNFGDCFAYACARVHGLPLLFKGNYFARTDIEAVAGRP